ERRRRLDALRGAGAAGARTVLADRLVEGHAEALAIEALQEAERDARQPDLVAGGNGEKRMRHGSTQLERPPRTSSLVSRAIMSSSLVGMTSTGTRLPAA